MPACGTGRQTDNVARYQSSKFKFIPGLCCQAVTLITEYTFCSPWARPSPLGASDSYQSSSQGSLDTTTGSEGQDGLVAWMQAILCLVCHYQTEPCAGSRYSPNVPFLSCGRAIRAQPQSDRESSQRELGLEQGPRQDGHQRGKKEGEAKLRGFAGGCARKPLEQPYGCRQCRAPPASITPVTIQAASPQQQGSAVLGWPWAPCPPSLRSAAARPRPPGSPGCGERAERAQVCGWVKLGVGGWSNPAELCSPQCSPAPPAWAHPWAQKRALGSAEVINADSACISWIFKYEPV